MHGPLTSPENRHLINLYSSVTAGATSTIVTNPIWVIKTRLMSQSALTLFPTSANTPTSRPPLSAPWHYRSTLDAARKMYTTEGIRSFYSGLSPALLGLTHVAVHIPVYEVLKQAFTGRPLGVPPPARDHHHHHHPGDDEGLNNHHHHAHVLQGTHWVGVLAASIMSKILASSATYPHEVIRTRMQTQRRPMAGETYLQGMGIAASPVSSSSPSSSSSSPHSSSPSSSSSSSSSSAPSTATEQQHHAPLKYRGVVHTFQTIMKEEGWRAFYAGMGTNMIRAVPAATVTFLTYEYVMAALNQARADGSRLLLLSEGK